MRDPGPSAGRVAGWALIGAGVASAGAGVAVGVLALDARDAFEASERTDAAAHERAERRRLWANVAFALALPLGAVALYFVLRDEGGDARADAAAPRVRRLALGLGPGQVRLDGDF